MRSTHRTRLRRFAIVALLAAMAASICFNAYLVREVFRNFEATATVRLDPAGLKVYARDRSTPHTGSPLLLFFGDSRALMWPKPATLAGYRTVNHGIGYQTTAQMLLRVDEDVVQMHPAVVVVEGGINDLKTIANFPERRAEIVADCDANLERIVERCRQTSAIVVLVTVFSIGDVSLWRRPFWSSEVSAAVRDVNSFLHKLGSERVVVFDADPVLVDEGGGIRRAYQMDQLHLSSAGYDALNETLGPLLTRLPR